MKKRICCFLIALSACFGANRARAQTYWVAAFGDSLTAGFGVDKQDAFPVQLADFLYEDGFSVGTLNYGKTGDTTRDALRRLQEVIARMPDVVIIQLGINDVIKGIPLNETEKNLSRMVAAAKKNEIAVLLAGVSMPKMTPETDVDAYAAMYRRIARKYNVPLYPNFTAGVANYATGAADYDLLGEDRMHPNAEGISVITEGILPQVKEILKALDVKYDSQRNPKKGAP